MRRINKISFYLLGLGGLLLTSCSSQPENLSLVPKNAQAVLVLDIYSLSEKGELDKIEDYKFYKEWTKKAKKDRGGKKAMKIMDKMMEDPSITGVNFQADVVVYMTNESRDEEFVSTTFELNDSEDFKTFIEESFDKLDVDIDIEEEDEYTYTLVDNEALLAWDDNKAVLIVASNRDSRENLELQAEELFELESDELITEIDDFNTFYGEKEDISVWVSTNIFKNEREFDFFAEQVDFDLEDNYITAFLNFGDDNISVSAKLMPNDELAEFIEENNAYANNQNSDLIELLPKQSLAFAGVSFDVDKMYESLKENKDFKRTKKSAEKELDADLDELIKSIGGNIVFSLINVEQKELTYMSYDWETGNQIEKTKEEMIPNMALSFDLNNSKAIKAILKSIPKEEIKKRGDYFEIKIDGSILVYYAYNEKACLITNDKKTIEAFKKGGPSANLTDNEFADGLTDNSMFGYITVNSNDLSKEMKNDMFKYQSKSEKEALKVWNKFAKNIVYSSEDGTDYKFVLNINEGDKNSLGTIIQLIDKNYKSVMKPSREFSSNSESLSEAIEAIEYAAEEIEEYDAIMEDMPIEFSEEDFEKIMEEAMKEAQIK